MKTKYSATELAKILADHKLYLNGDPAGIRAVLRGAYLGGADLTGADLGAKTVMGRMLRLLGACEDSVQWVESKPKKSIAALVKEARKDHPDWIQWAVARGIIAEEK